MASAAAKDTGEVSEWLKEQPWKGCVWLVCTAGSNPALSVTFLLDFPILCIDRLLSIC